MSKPWAAAALALALAPSAHAGVGQGDFEAGVGIAYSQTKTSVDQDTGFGTCTVDTTNKMGSFGLNGGYFITDMIEARVAFTETRNDTDTDSCGTNSSSSSTLGVFSPGADFVFLGKSGKVAPFAGAAYGLAFGDSFGGVDTDYIDVHAGAKFFLNERAAIELKLTRFEPTDSAADGRTELAAGINIYF